MSLSFLVSLDSLFCLCEEFPFFKVFSPIFQQIWGFDSGFPSSVGCPTICPLQGEWERHWVLFRPTFLLVRNECVIALYDLLQMSKID